MYLSRRYRRGRIEVRALPEGCEVRLDGKFAGTAPLTVAGVSPGNHFVELRSPGHAPRVVRIEVRAGRTETVEEQLRSLPSGAIHVESSPSGATVELDGEGRGNTPLIVRGLPAGKHRLVLRRARCDVWSKVVTVRAGEVEKVSVTLEDSHFRFLNDAVEARPGDLTARADLIHYLRTQSHLDLMERHAAQGLLAAVKQKNPEGGKYLWLMIYRESRRLPTSERRRFLKALAVRTAAMCGKDAALKVKLVERMAESTRYSRHRFNREIARELTYATAARLASQRGAVERALELAGDARDAEQAAGLLAAAAEARPPDGERVGGVAVKALNLVKAGKFGSSSRSRVLRAAVAAVEACLRKERKDRVVRARLLRLLARLHLADEKKVRALAELDRAIAELRPAGAAQAALADSWRLERAGLLVDLKRGEEAKKLLRDLAAGAASAEIRKKAAEKLGKL
jgi:hypothetical protein